MIKDYTILAWRNLRKRKLRSWLTAIGIIISIATIFVLISISIGLQSAVEEQFRMLGTDKFFVQAKGQLGALGTGGAVELTGKDVEAIKKVRGVKEVTYFVAGNARIEYNEQTKYVIVMGLDLETSDMFLESGSLEPIDGRALRTGDERSVGLGYDYKYGKVFDKPIDVGDTILINDVVFKVKGIMSRVGNPSDDKNIFMPEADAREIFNIPERVDAITVQVNQGEDIREVADLVDRKLQNTRGVSEKTKDFDILTPEELLGAFGNILNIITAFLAGIAAISLVVGGIGIMNTMYTSVLERTKEIGVMKAVGAKNSDILWIFLIESGLIGLIGGIMGVVLGFGVAKLIEYIVVNQLNTTLLRAAAPPALIFGCLAFAFLAGAISGIWPAWRATKIKIVDALRYE
ncbi:MAG: ABC transporter permease [Nanoarchaeota archaeon]|nr:ABC transporter permease [Nanoarchaeota archaeon]